MSRGSQSAAARIVSSVLRRGAEAAGKRWLLWVLLVAGLLVAFALRAYRLGGQNVWWDEGLTVWATRKSLVETTLWTAGDVHPPLYFLLVWPWIRLAGDSEFAVRYLTAAQGLLTVALVFPLGRRLAGRPVGVGALWLLGLSRFHVWWSQEMRMYALAALCAALSLYFLLRAVTSRPSVRPWAAWVVATAGALYTIYLSVLLLVLQNLFVLIVSLRRTDRWALWRRWLVAQGALAGVFLPWLALALPRMRSWSVVGPPPSLGFVLELDAVLLALGISTDIERYRWAGVLLAIIVALGVAMVAWKGRRDPGPHEGLSHWEGLLLPLLGVLLGPVMVWMATRPRSLFYVPMVEARYFVAWAPLFYVLLAWSLAGLLCPRVSRPLGVLASLGVLAAFLWALPGHYAGRYLRDELQTLTRLVWTYARPDDALVLVSEDRYPLFLYYYDRAPAPAGRPPVDSLSWLTATTNAETAERELEAFAENRRRIWLAQVESHLQDPQGLSEAWLKAHYARPLSFRFDHNALHLFAQDAEEPLVPKWNVGPQYALSRTLGPGLELLGYDLVTQEFRPADTIRLGLYLQATRPATLTVGMVHPQGEEVDRLVLQLPATDGVIRRQAEFRVAPYAPAGRYDFSLSVENGETVQVGQARVTHTLAPPALDDIPRPVSARLGEDLQFLGYGLSGVGPGEPPTASPGDVLTLDLYWQATGRIEQDYTVFTHLVGEAVNPASGGPVWAQHDQEPLASAYPTSLWLPGRPLRDRYELTVPSDAPPGDYQLEVGMYLLESRERLPVVGERADPAARRLILTAVRIVP